MVFTGTGNEVRADLHVTGISCWNIAYTALIGDAPDFA